MSEILLTYIVPVYNTEPYVLKCLQSLVDQGLSPEQYEIIAVDDESTDGTLAVVESFAREHPQVRVLCQPHLGVSSARNLALENAHGRYIQFVDSDDYLMGGSMVNIVQRAMDLDLDVQVLNNRMVFPDGTVTVATGTSSSSTEAMTGVEYLKGHSMTPYIWRYLIRREFFEQHHWRFNPSLIVCEDGEVIARFMLQASRVAHYDAAPYCYVKRADSAMHNTNLDHVRHRLFCQVDSAASIDATIRQFQENAQQTAPVSVAGLRNVYLFFAMTRAFTAGLVDEVLARMRAVGMYPFPCVGPEANYGGAKWKVIHRLMMQPRLWSMLSKLYRMIKK